MSLQAQLGYRFSKKSEIQVENVSVAVMNILQKNGSYSQLSSGVSGR